MLYIPSNAIATTLTPRVSETDGCGHINNTVLPVWFEAGRYDIFRAVTPSLSFAQWRLAVVSMRVDFRAQTYLDREVRIHTWIARIGTKSFTIHEAAEQDGRRCADGECVYVCFDYDANLSMPVPEDVRARLARYVSDGAIAEMAPTGGKA